MLLVLDRGLWMCPIVYWTLAAIVYWTLAAIVYWILAVVHRKSRG